jgi:hypothetical protein
MKKEQSMEDTTRTITDDQALIAQLLDAAVSCEKNGDLANAQSTYLRILELVPHHRLALLALIELCRDMGEVERALSYIGEFQEEGELLTQVTHVELLLEAGQIQDAEIRLSKLISDPEVKSDGELLRKLQGFDKRLRNKLSPSFTNDDLGAALMETAGPTDADLLLMADLFSGREGVHARQWKSRDGRCGYSPVHQQLTPNIIRQHLLGASTVGAYVVKRNNHCAFSLLDIDAKLEDDGDNDLRMTAAWTVTKSIAAMLRNYGLVPLIEDSGAKGYHVWIFFEDPQPTWKVRRLLRQVVSKVEQAERVSIEVFPAQAEVKNDGLGNLVKLPLGLHLKSDRYSRIVDEQAKAVRDPFSLLRTLPRVSSETLEAMLAELGAEDPPSLSQKAESTGLRIVKDDDIADVVRPQWIAEDDYRIEEDGEVQYLISKCKVLGEIYQAAMQGRLLTAHEQAVLTYTVGHLSSGPKAVNRLLSSTKQNTNPLKARLRGHPTGCAKIRSRLGILTGERGCDCEFDETLGEYAHPLLHLSFLRAENRALDESRAETQEDVGALEKELCDLSESIKKMTDSANRLRNRIDKSKVAAVEIAGPKKVIPEVSTENALRKEL